MISMARIKQADFGEAATRARKDPTSGMVAERVQRVIETRVSEGELNDCNLTLKDLAKIQETFTSTLSLGVYHNRIDHPPVLSPNGLSSGGQKNNGMISDANKDNRIHSVRGVVDRPA